MKKTKKNKNKTVKNLKIATFIGEVVLAVPLLGGAIIVGFFWIPLIIMLILHILTLTLALEAKEEGMGSMVGIAASMLGFVPLLGWVCHLVTACLLGIDLFGEK